MQVNALQLSPIKVSKRKNAISFDESSEIAPKCPIARGRDIYLPTNFGHREILPKKGASSSILRAKTPLMLMRPGHGQESLLVANSDFLVGDKNKNKYSDKQIQNVEDENKLKVDFILTNYIYLLHICIPEINQRGTAKFFSSR